MLNEAYNTVVASNAKVSQRFPSGLGALIKKACKGLDGASEQLEVLHRVRTGSNGSSTGYRASISMITESAVVEKLFGEIAEQFVDRNGGYTRVVKAETEMVTMLQWHILHWCQSL